MREIAGNLWDLPGDAICVTTNGVVAQGGRLVMGGGCAREARERHPDLPLVWGQMTINFGPGVWVYESVVDRPLVSFPTKYHWREPSDMMLIVKSAHELVDVANHRGWADVLVPRPGAGLGMLAWDDVKAWIGPILDDRFIAVTFGP